MMEKWLWLKAHWQVGLVAVVVLITAIGWGLGQLAQPEPQPANVLAQAHSAAARPAGKPASHQAGRTANSIAAPATEAYVDIKGAVKRPGLYRVQASMRVADVVRLAQGLLPQADQQQVNLAAKVRDQQVIYVPAKGEQHPVLPPTTAPAASAGPVGATSASTEASGASGAGVNLNTADAQALQTLQGIGAKKAQKIIDYRQQHGPFKSVDDLKNVAGFGEKTVAKYKDKVSV
ncbi:helix-hairpin-helix domain-containing protein [Lactiplantibacillus modestisalitolerans]|uniref:Helix-hairpin-helix domain-containing protein n=1 Tax=Lactiplantibacillus modestisalitolerans TaxID=1457219 RepID=A0ABV5WTB6_9LACO|nr:helix-hairpin-helix domain-containing protein [Lactiplantibacillus modestisalitolerans]